ncbi:hypothetical protein [Phaeocystidibacter marisrubri]|uniref:Uncharacterized protein n=1 Tax=Phaeocystidibacter marisrubri TaxID=1577780 RepID=A0A6L3ZG81_9FLAO|nr:hypothetical protein [Phaeocystidibacter marisrubri]KAB2817046.1 hypothetical protein F8C82_01230 [Phaeocystidibacter marisrubri]GGH77075.1 hypothetical protein GCM10011318_26300 [Phaeocystidibacter marisrubri]
MSTALGGIIAGVGMQSMGAWPKWLGGNDVSDEGCSCQDYKPVNEERNFHWLICPIKCAWGWRDTGMQTTAIIHYDYSCEEHGHQVVLQKN